MSNHTNDPWEKEMSRTFDQRVRDLHEAPLSFDQVKGKAGRIRRTRRLAVAGGALAAAAVIVPIVVFAGGKLTDDSGPEPAPKPKETATDPNAPGFGYLEGKTLHRADGSTTDLAARYTWATEIGDTLFAVRNDDETGNLSLDVLDESGTPTETVPLSSYPIVNDDHTVLGYIETDGDLITRGEAADSVLSTAVPANALPTTLTGGADCENDGCVVYFEPEGGGGESFVVSVPSGIVDPAVPDTIGVQDADETGRSTVQISYTDQGSCGGVAEPGGNGYVYLWQTCDFFLFEISPGSKYVDATHAYLDGFGNAYASILDAATGREIIRFDPPDGTITQTVWQDSEHLLAKVYGADGWSVYRIGADKTVDQILEPTGKGNDVDPAYTVLD